MTLTFVAVKKTHESDMIGIDQLGIIVELARLLNEFHAGHFVKRLGHFFISDLIKRQCQNLPALSTPLPDFYARNFTKIFRLDYFTIPTQTPQAIPLTFVSDLARPITGIVAIGFPDNKRPDYLFRSFTNWPVLAQIKIKHDAPLNQRVGKLVYLIHKRSEEQTSELQ